MQRVRIADTCCQLRRLWPHAALRPAQALSGWSWMRPWNSHELETRCDHSRCHCPAGTSAALHICAAV